MSLVPRRCFWREFLNAGSNHYRCYRAALTSDRNYQVNESAKCDLPSRDDLILRKQAVWDFSWREILSMVLFLRCSGPPSCVESSEETRSDASLRINWWLLSDSQKCEGRVLLMLQQTLKGRTLEQGFRSIERSHESRYNMEGINHWVLCCCRKTISDFVITAWPHVLFFLASSLVFYDVIWMLVALFRHRLSIIGTPDAHHGNSRTPDTHLPDIKDRAL